jgi:uncharacterized protein YjiS (DUF1127 family)
MEGASTMFGSVVSALKAAVSAVAEWRRREIARAELESLDDRTLADIGINRAEIPFVVSGRLRRAEPAYGHAAAPSFAANANGAARTAA